MPLVNLAPVALEIDYCDLPNRVKFGEVWLTHCSRNITHLEQTGPTDRLRLWRMQLAHSQRVEKPIEQV
jgi:hypothetical protein